MNTSNMPSESEFTFIEQYKNLARELEEQSCTDNMISMDQEVPQIRSYSEEGDIKPNIKMEVQESQQQDLYSCMEQIFASTESTFSNQDITTITSSLSMSMPSQYVPLTVSAACTENSSNAYSISSPSTNVSSTSGLQSVSSSPLLSSAAVPSLPTSQSPLSSTPFTNIVKSEPNVVPECNGLKTRSFVTELGGSGCTLVTSSSPDTSFTTDFLSGEAYPPSAQTLLSDSVAPPSMCVPEGSLNYLDLDKQPLSLYDDVKPGVETLKLENFTAPAEDNSVPLEEAAMFMRDVIHHDCDSLNVPYDPMLWNVENVRTWVAWVCQKNGVPDLSAQMQPMNGRMLCSLYPGDFRTHYGRIGESLSTELELWKAANSCFPEVSFNGHQSQMPFLQSQQQLPSFVDKDVGRVGGRASGVGPCVSPAPSTGSSSQDSQLACSGSFSDHSDDENSFMFSSVPDREVQVNKTGGSKLGRGHKQTTHLWEFLRELLLSKENHTDCIRWLDRNAGIFKIEDSKKVAYLWGVRKNRPAMNYDKLSRSVRQYYKKGIIQKTKQSKRLVYQFCAGFL